MNSLQVNKRLLICMSDPADLEYITVSIHVYFGDILEIESVSPSRLSEVSYTPAAVIASYLTIGLIRKRFPNSKIIFPQRNISGQALEEVIHLPINSNVLVVNEPLAVAEETKDSLLDLGISHIHMTAYSPGEVLDKTQFYDAIIYTGNIRQCPDIDCSYIDIGLRKISLSTIVDIVKTFDLSSDCAKHYYIDNIQQITTACYKIDSALKAANTLKQNFEKVCDINNNITFVIDENDKVVLFNQTAINYFELGSAAEVIESNYKAVLQEYPSLIACLTSMESLEDTLITIGDQQLTISSFDMFIDDKKNTAITLVPLSILQKKEALVRKKLRSTGFVARHTFHDLLGSSNIMKQSKSLARIYAKTDFPVLITGESGTGKEMFAQAIHNASARSGAPFVAINFAALPESLAESELFGFTEGAFTGATKGGKAGIFELAHKGTIFLDEIGDASLPMQAKLLRVLEEKEIIRIGGTDVIPIDVRIVCATNKDLEAAMEEGSFRSDLYYRIKVLNLQLCPLREHPEDIFHILSSLLRGQAAYDLANKPKIKAAIMNYRWPGNTRELRTVAEYITMLTHLTNKTEACEMLNLYIINNFRSIQKKTGTQAVPEVMEDLPNSLSPDLIAILQAILFLQNSGAIAGRSSICKTAMVKKRDLTEAKVKTRLKKLEEMGLLSIRTTKQGTILTEKGMNTLRCNTLG